MAGFRFLEHYERQTLDIIVDYHTILCFLLVVGIIYILLRLGVNLARLVVISSTILIFGIIVWFFWIPLLIAGVYIVDFSLWMLNAVIVFTTQTPF